MNVLEEAVEHGPVRCHFNIYVVAVCSNESCSNNHTGAAERRSEREKKVNEHKKPTSS